MLSVTYLSSFFVLFFHLSHIRVIEVWNIKGIVVIIDGGAYQW